MREVIQEAKTVEEAIDLACQKLGVDRGDAEFEILTLPKRGFLGLRNTPAKVRVSVEDPQPEEKPQPRREERPRREKPTQQQPRRERPERPAQQPPHPERPECPHREKPVERPAPHPVEQPEEPQVETPRQEEHPAPQKALEFVPAQTLEGKPRAAADYLQTVLTQMGIQAEITAAFPENGVILRLAGEGLGVIIGRRGETLDALQYLCGLVANRQEGDYLRVTIDSGNYRQKRERTLEQLAKKLSANVVRYGRPSTLEPMNPYERRIIHATVSKLEGVTSSSIGEEPNRRVVISPTNPRPSQPGRGRQGGRGGRPGGGRGGRGGRDRREGGFRENRAPRENRESQVTPTSVDREYAREIEREAPSYVAPDPAEKPEVTREVVPPTRAQARKEGEDLPLYGKIEL